MPMINFLPPFFKFTLYCPALWYWSWNQCRFLLYLLALSFEGVQGERVPEEETSFDLVASSLLAPRAQTPKMMRREIGDRAHILHHLCWTPVEGFLNASLLEFPTCHPLPTGCDRSWPRQYNDLLCQPAGPATLSPMKPNSQPCRECPTPSVFLPQVQFLSPRFVFEFSFVPS